MTPSIRLLTKLSILSSSDQERLAILQHTDPDWRLPNLHKIVPPEHLHPIVKMGFKNVTIYRAVPENINVIRPGDWVSLTPTHEHKGKIISKRVPADHVAWAGTDKNEYYYVPRS